MLTYLSLGISGYPTLKWYEWNEAGIEMDAGEAEFGKTRDLEGLVKFVERMRKLGKV
jgi:hypothetical protein